MGGCYGSQELGQRRKIVVSILTRPRGRVLQKTVLISNSRMMFQSSPAHVGGCYLQETCTAPPSPSFQSSPAHVGGCYLCEHPQALALHPFQSSPAHVGGCYPSFHRGCSVMASFNPHPPTWAGATRSPWIQITDKSGFNPHPPTWAGATFIFPFERRNKNVSILTRPRGRVLLVLPVSSLYAAEFQSSPAHVGGCYGASS